MLKNYLQNNKTEGTKTPQMKENTNIKT